MKYILSLFTLLCFQFAQAQTDMDLLLRAYNNRTVPYISVQELREEMSKYLILDTRKKEEYKVSHINGAIWASEKVVDTAFAKAYPKKDNPIVVYCSVGIRSEDYGEQLQKLGYTNVKNLYGSIFAWKDAGYDVVNANQKVTDSVHVFSKIWGNHLNTGIKIYE